MVATLGRLRKRSEFLAVAAANRRWTTPGVTLQARARPDDAPDAAESAFRLGFTATKKIGGAVVRNRARRRLRAAAAEVLKDAAPRPVDLVLVARPGTVGRVYADLKTDLEAALRRLAVVS